MDNSPTIGVCAIGVHGARLIWGEAAYARVLLLSEQHLPGKRHAEAVLTINP
jgi:hypothetical protein